MKIVEIKENKKQYLDLLLLADEQEDMIDRYLEEGSMFVLFDNGIKAECVISKGKNRILEIKNIAVNPKYKRKGYGRYLINYLENYFKEDFSILRVGTGDSPLTLNFYKSCGFKESFRVKNFFLDNYDHPIYEEGKLLTDMVYLEKLF